MTTTRLIPLFSFLKIGVIELLVLLILLGGALVVAGVIVWLVVRSSSRRQTPPSQTKTRADRLRELEALRAQALLTTEEYERRRRQILDEI